MSKRSQGSRRRRNRYLALGALAGAAALRARSRRRERQAAEVTVPTVARDARVQGVPMRWEELGDVESTRALPIVFVHGIPTSPRLWRYVLPRVATPGVRCLAWEMVGFGESLDVGLERDVSVAAQNAYLDAFLRHLGIERAILVGHDLGGGVVQRFAVERPQRCLGLVLVDCVAYDNWPVPAVRAARQVAGLIERLPPALVRPAFMALLMRLGHDEEGLYAESARLHWRPYARPEGPRALAHQIRALDARDTLSIAHGLPHLKVPASVVWAEHDPLGMASGEQLADDLGATLHVIQGAHHFTPEDHPDVVAEAVREVMDAVLRAPPPGAGPVELR